MNSDETEPDIEIVSERGQARPADWPSDVVPLSVFKATVEDDRTWVRVGSVKDFPIDGGGTIRYGYAQIAVFQFASRGEWYATSNMCPHKREFVLSRGILGDAQDEPKVACPLHKKTFSLKTGECLTGEAYSIDTYPVKVDGEDVLLFLPPSRAPGQRPRPSNNAAAKEAASRSCRPSRRAGCAGRVPRPSSHSAFRVEHGRHSRPYHDRHLPAADRIAHRPAHARR